MEPLIRANPIRPSDDKVAEIIAFCELHGAGRQTALDLLDEHADAETWMNDMYVVIVRRTESVTHLSIRRQDREAQMDWRDFQCIKNQLVGEECEGIELFPAESRLVDTSNQRHLWCFNDPTFRVPVGFDERLVTGEAAGGAVQRPFAA